MNTATTTRKALCFKITTTIDDPGQWLLAVRRVSDALNLNPAESIELSGTLESVAFHMIEVAKRYGRSFEDMVSAIDAV